MIDTNELRRKLGSDDLIDHIDIHSSVKPVLTEILDRLEAAESDAIEQARLNGMGASREAALMAKLEVAEKERESWKGLAQRFGNEADGLRTHLSFAKDEMNRLRSEAIHWKEQKEPGAAREREACAKVCDEMSGSDYLPHKCAAAIRARGDA